MQVIEKYEGLSDVETREYLGKELHKADYAGDEQLLEIYQRQLEDIREKIKNAQKCVVLKTLIKSKGWTEFDISDHVTADDSKGCYPFVGTEPEYNEFMKQFQDGE